MPDAGVTTPPHAGPLVEGKPAPNGSPHAPPTPGVDANYQYWRDHGQDWGPEYDKRKRRQILYHIQEIMLTQYVGAHAAPTGSPPTRVLEFGCGVGRHLRNLRTLPGVDAHGFDQSAAMARGCLAWADRAWFDSHVTVGSPTGRLPYPDAQFDLVYTAEVLVHVRPEHVPDLLRELLRVCRGHVFHLETSEFYKLHPDAHDGCWYHDLPALYRAIGRECEVLAAGYEAHAPYRVNVGVPSTFAWDPSFLALCRRMERDIDAGFAETDAALAGERAAAQEARAALDAANTNAEHLAQSLAAAHARHENLAIELRAARSQVEALAPLRGELDAARAATESLSSQVAVLQARLAELAAAEGAARGRADALTAELTRAKADLSALITQAALRARLDAEELGALRARHAQDLAALNDRIRSLDALAGASAHEVARLHAAQSEFLKQVAGSLRG